MAKAKGDIYNLIKDIEANSPSMMKRKTIIDMTISDIINKITANIHGENIGYIEYEFSHIKDSDTCHYSIIDVLTDEGFEVMMIKRAEFDENMEIIVYPKIYIGW